MKNVSDLLAVLNLEEQSSHTFNGISKTVGSPNVFGGQVLAQAVHAAYRTINNGRWLHSLHSYFLEAGDLNFPIAYEVAIIRDGGSFSTRRVTAKQNDSIIFILAASFHKKEEGYEHQVDIKTDIKRPEDLLSWDDLYKRYGFFLPKKVASFLKIERPVIFKPTIILNPLRKKDLKPYSDVWFKVKGDTTNLSVSEKQQVLTYLSDYNILAAALYPHASKAHFGNTQMASLDHAMWFFRDCDLDDWLLFTVDVPSTSNARGFTRAHIYTRYGKLVASVTQEGLMRPKK